MSYPNPIPGPATGDGGWLAYSNWTVTYTSRQGTVMTCMYFASSSAEAISFLNYDKIKASLFGPYTNVSATNTPTATGAGD